MEAAKQIQALLKQDGAVLIRKKNHYVYRLSNGKPFVQPSTRSDKAHGAFKGLRDLKELLGMEKESKLSSPHPKRNKHTGKQAWSWSPDVEAPSLESFKQKFLKAGYQPPEPPEKHEPEREEPEPPRIRREKHEKPKCFSYPPDVLAEASRILDQHGSSAYNEYLRQHRESAVEVGPAIRVHIHQENKTLEETMEMRVTLARKHVTRLLQDNEDTKTKIDETYKLIVEMKQRIVKNDETVKHLNDFVNSFEIVMAESKIVDEVITPLEKMSMQPGKAKNGVIAISGDDMLKMTQHLLSRENGATSSELLACVMKHYPSVKGSQIHSFVNYELSKTHSRIVRTGERRATRYLLAKTKSAAA